MLRIEAPSVAPARGGLLAVAQELAADPHAAYEGVTYNQHLGGVARRVPAPGVEKIATRPDDVVESERFAVYYAVETDPFRRDEAVEIARTTLERGSTVAVERAVQENLLNASAVVLGDTTDGESPKVALGLLEQWAGLNYAGLPMLHLSRFGVPFLSDLEVDTDRWLLYTNQGTPVVNGAGYSGVGPTGDVAPAGKFWMYISAQVFLIGGEISVSDGPNLPANEWLALAERIYVPTMEPVVAAVLVNAAETSATTPGNQAPTITGADNTSVDYDATFDPMAGVTASDAEDGDLTDQIQVDGTVDTTTPGDQTITYSVTDSAGTTTTVPRTITVGEPPNEPPTLSGVTDVTVDYGADFDPMAGVTATDPEDGDITGQVQVQGTVDTETPGDYSLDYSVTDSGGASASASRTVTVSEPPNQPPTISGVADSTITQGDTFDPMAGVTATDPEDGDITSEVQVQGTVDTETPGDYPLTYTVTDSGGLTDEANCTVTVTAA